MAGAAFIALRTAIGSAPYPHDPQLQCMGLRFDFGDEDAQ
jgi:hypothetical protein